MSVRFLKLNNTIGIANNLLELFDPRINDNFTRNGDVFCIKHVVNTLNTLYCRENLAQYDIAKELISDGLHLSREEWSSLNAFLDLIPDDQRFIVAFMARKGRVNVNAAKIRSYIPGYISPSLNYLEADTSLQSIDTPLTIETFTTFINNTYEPWKRAFESKSDYTRWGCSYIPILAPFTRMFAKYCENTSMFNYNGRVANVLEVLQSIRNEPTAQLNYEIREDRTLKLKIVVPISRTNRAALYNLMNYTTNVLDFLPYPNMEKREKEPVLVGVELEISTDYNPRELIEAAEDPFFLAKQDSSISGQKNNLMELVTAPSSFKYLKRQYALWFNKLDYNKFDVTTDTNNGMHVHVGRDHFEDNTHIRNFCWFFNNPANMEFLLYISERTRDSLNRWSPMYSFHHSYSRTHAFRHIYEMLGSGFRGITNFKGGWERATTIEVRMFKGVVSYASIVKNLEFVEAVFHFTKGLTSYRHLTLSGFFRWLDEQPKNKYTLLRKFIDQAGDRNEKFIFQADLKDWLFNITDHEKIAERLNRAPFKITHKHISVLNKGKKRTFIINKETGKVQVIHHNRSKLASMDQSFAARYLHNVNAA